MRIYLDESGDFRIPLSDDENAVGIVVGVVIPETKEPSILERFNEFTERLQSHELKNGEPKGSLFGDDSRRRFANFIAHSDGLLLCPTMLDLTSLARRPEFDVKTGVSRKLREWASKCKHDEMRREVTKLANQVGNLSLQQVIRLAAWARCIKRCVIDSVVFHSGQEFDVCWENMRFEIDPVDRRPGKGEQPVFRTMLPAWVCAWSVNEPFSLIEEVHTPDHPFVKNFDTSTGVDFGKMIRGNIKYPRSEASPGIQIADIASSAIVAKVVRGLVSADDLHNYGIMMTRAIRPPLEATGLFSFVDPSLDDWRKRFYGMSEAIAGAKGFAW